MPGPASPRKVFESLLQGISAGRWHELADLYAEDAVVQMPFAPGGPDGLTGREAIRAHFRSAAGGPLKPRGSNVVVHETTDPELIIAEFDYHGQVITTGRTFQVSNIQVLRIRNGQIVSSRDYHDHLALAAGMGRLRELIGSLSDQE
jgi:uncharacterized protein